MEDPHIQAFTILSDRVSNLEEDMRAVRSCLAWQEMRQSGRLNKDIFGYQFEVRCIREEAEKDCPVLSASVVTVHFDPDDGDDIRDAVHDATKMDLPCELDVICGGSFSHVYKFPDDYSCSYGLIGQTTVQNHIDEAVRRHRTGPYQKRKISQVDIYPCDMLALYLFYTGIQIDLTGVGTIAGSSLRRIKTNAFFSSELNLYPKFAARLEEQLATMQYLESNGYSIP